jgi:hypothetical protein
MEVKRFWHPETIEFAKDSAHTPTIVVGLQGRRSRLVNAITLFDAEFLRMRIFQGLIIRFDVGRVAGMPW